MSHSLFAFGESYQPSFHRAVSLNLFLFFASHSLILQSTSLNHEESEMREGRSEVGMSLNVAPKCLT